VSVLKHIPRIARWAAAITVAFIGALGVMAIAGAYTLEGGYFPGGPMHFTGQTVAWIVVAIPLLLGVLCLAWNGTLWIMEEVFGIYLDDD